MKVYILVEITDYDCTDEEKILGVYQDTQKAHDEKIRLDSLEIERVKKNPHHRDPFNYFYEVREYEVIQ